MATEQELLELMPKAGRGERKMLTAIAATLAPDELALAAVHGQSVNDRGKDTIGVAVATDRRLIYSGSLVFDKAYFEMPMAAVDSVSMSKMLLATITVSVAGRAFVMTRCNPQLAAEFVEILRGAAQAAKQQGGSAGAAPPDLAGSLAQLGQLHSSGVLSDEEFARAKAKLLDRSDD